MQEIYITHAKRTATGSFFRQFINSAGIYARTEVIKAILTESDIEHEQIDEIILEQVLIGGSGQNPARQSSIYAGIPVEQQAMTINKVCGSGLKVVALAASW